MLFGLLGPLVVPFGYGMLWWKGRLPAGAPAPRTVFLWVYVVCMIVFVLGVIRERWLRHATNSDEASHASENGLR